MGLPGKLEGPVLRYGYLGGISHIVREVLSRFLKIQLVYRETAEVSRVSSVLKSQVVGVESEVVDSAVLDNHCPDWRARLHHGNCLVCVMAGDELAGFGWGRWQRELGFTYVDSRLALPHDIFYIYDCYTLATCRGKGVYQAVLKSLADVAGNDPVYVACRWNNTGSIRGIGKAGFMLDRVFIFFRILGLPVRFHF